MRLLIIRNNSSCTLLLKTKNCCKKNVFLSKELRKSVIMRSKLKVFLTKIGRVKTGVNINTNTTESIDYESIEKNQKKILQKSISKYTEITKHRGRKVSSNSKII